MTNPAQANTSSCDKEIIAFKEHLKKVDLPWRKGNAEYSLWRLLDLETDVDEQLGLVLNYCH